jgi:hypothetical protein
MPRASMPFFHPTLENAMQKLLTIAAVSTITAAALFAQHSHNHAQPAAEISKPAPKADAAKAGKPTKEQALAAFKKLKKFAGKWQCNSPGLGDFQESYKLIAEGSVLMGNEMEDKPESAMVTMYHMDGDTLMLTHYCMAKNQPRLTAMKIADDLSSVTFEYKDGTNMASRDVGHMDSVVINFVDDDNFKSRWSWYEKGKEQWMEAVTAKRMK